jgi:hypothetical protein
MKRALTTSFAAVAFCLVPFAVSAEGNLAALPTDLELAIDGRNLTFSETEYHLETGKYYRWEITSDGYESVTLRAPELFRNSWIGQVVIDDTEVQVGNGLYGIGFDDEGDAVIFFVPIRPGNYEFFVPGFEERGLRGTFVVR